ncbi:MAG: ferredoxin:Oxidoreductase FAD/NAD(P)-binding:OxidoreductaseFAD-binding region [Osedax symbiont Rs2]|nr:MAG: ferredoxin:Oxidoreductase FAD/NAD(P)-binding:OxidoreductaseFAD-binding region [Osedax symbiont Rs2]
MSIVRLSPSGKEIQSQAGETVLSTLENAGYALPNNCRAGACGECKVKVLKGEFDQGIVLDMALSAQEREEGYGLMCMAKPLTDEIDIEWGTEDAQPKLFPPRENVRCVIIDKIQRTERITEIRLRPVGDPLRYWPGQYITVTDTERKIAARAYSIANAPRSDGEIKLQITKVPDGNTSNWVHDRLHAGSMINISGPFGTFIGDPSTDGPVLCLAAGTGLTPILALTDAALRRGFKQPVHLLFSARTEAEIYDKGLMAYWNIKHRRFKFIPTLTRENKEGILQGHIPKILSTVYPDLSKHSIYIAGSPEFVDACLSAALSCGATEQNIHSEGFFNQHIEQG